MNIWTSWSAVFHDSLVQVGSSFIMFVPNLIFAVLLFVVGWLLGNVVARAFEQVFATLKVDNLLKSIGTDELFRKAGLNLDSGYFVGQLVKWFVIIVFLLPSLSLVGLDIIASFLKDSIVSQFLPNLIIATFVLIIAAFVSQLFSRVITASAKSVGLVSANLLGAIAKYSVWVFAFSIALDKLGVDPVLLQYVVMGFVFMISLGGALAFGLGGRDAAAKLIAKISDEASSRS